MHGLEDSPQSFVDIGQELADEGFLVRTVLLPDHGTRPGDMVNVDHNDWHALVNRQVELLKSDVVEVYLSEIIMLRRLAASGTLNRSPIQPARTTNSRNGYPATGG